MKILILAGYTPSLINFRGDFIREMVARGHEVVAVGPEAGFEEEVAALGATFVRLAFDRTGINPLSDLALIRRMIGLIKAQKPDVVFGYTMKPVIYGSIAARLSGVKRVFSMVTGLGYVFLANGAKAYVIRNISKMIYYVGLKCSTKVFFQNPDDRGEFIRAGLVGKSKCVLIHGSGVNLEKFASAPLPDRPIFLMICRILKDKGVLEYLEAARRVKASFPEARFQLLGPFDVNPNALSMEDIRPYVDDGTVEYLGETKDVRPYLAACSVYVLPSYREGTPRTVLEAMAMGRPVITTDVPGCRETVVDGMNGFLVPAKTVEPLAEKLRWVIGHPNEAMKMAKASLAICRDKYDVRKVNESILAAMDLNSMNGSVHDDRRIGDRAGQYIPSGGETESR
ncbi:glycosyltransferase family 4 protein [Paenibacillus sp.]|uniref:glycosyltransferase family 4 protein n=1 Tax=Paenibacillus sp. TaxID=58172 RepID=UPI00281138E0|nr:glycosyltransferase family 4 protein [Paenibacillus sp.]